MRRRCIYCGRELEIGRVCRRHADLPRRDPHFNPLVTKRWSDLRTSTREAR